MHQVKTFHFLPKSRIIMGFVIFIAVIAIIILFIWIDNRKVNNLYDEMGHAMLYGTRKDSATD